MCTLFVGLFATDFFAVLQVPTNTALDVVLSAAFMIFTFEFVSNTFVELNYPFSFLFFTDLIGTFSLLFDMSYMGGADVTQPERLAAGTHRSGNMSVLRAVRTARLAARAGRISRVVKLVRFLPFMTTPEGEEEDDDREERMRSTSKAKTANTISNHIMNDISMKIALLSICVVVGVPLFTMSTYPQSDESMLVWTQLLAKDVVAYADGGEEKAQRHLERELKRFSESYVADEEYGPFRICSGSVTQGGAFSCHAPEAWVLGWDADFEAPMRNSSILEVSTANFQARFDLSTPRRREALASAMIVVFIILTMCSFSMIMTADISVIALRPLERMLATVRQRCGQIFLYTDELQDDDDIELPSDEEDDDFEMELLGEFSLLEKAVVKLTAIAQIAKEKEGPEDQPQDFTDDDLMHLNFKGYRTTSENSAGVRSHTLSTANWNARSSRATRKTSSNNETSSRNTRATQATRLTAFSGPVIEDSIFQALETWDFSVLDLSRGILVGLVPIILTTHEPTAQWVETNVNEEKLVKLAHVVESKYLDCPFHNFRHAVDVIFAVGWFLKRCEAEMFFTEAQHFAIMVAALGHDVGHPGVNNQFLTETSHDLALKYNDRSPLEMMHCSTFFEILGEGATNIFEGLEKDLYKLIRKHIIEAILHTDLTKHNDMIKELNILYEVNADVFEKVSSAQISRKAVDLLETPTNNVLMQNALLHGADVNNPMKPWDLCCRIAAMILDEFFAQGDQEKTLGVPVQMLNDRDKVNRKQSQIGFIEFLIAPFTIPMVRIFPNLDFLADNLGANLGNWCETWVEESKPPEETAEKTRQRVQKVQATCNGVARRARTTTASRKATGRLGTGCAKKTQVE